MSDLDLAPIKARLRAALPARGSWERQWHENEHSGWTGWRIGYPLPPHGRIDGWACVAKVEADRPGRGTYHGEGRAELADLITNAPTDMDALVAEVERLRGLIAPGLAPALSN